MTSRRKAAPAARVGVLAVVPHVRGNPLPQWTPIAPRGGWTPASALAAAIRYGGEHAPGDKRAAYAEAAFIALCWGVPMLGRENIRERLRGTNVLAEYLRATAPASASRRPEPDVVDDQDDDEDEGEPPF